MNLQIDDKDISTCPYFTKVVVQVFKAVTVILMVHLIKLQEPLSLKLLQLFLPLIKLLSALFQILVEAVIFTVF
jgi:hypothetical protein